MADRLLSSRVIVRPWSWPAWLLRFRRDVVLRVLLAACAVTLCAAEWLVRLFGWLVWLFER
jgi:type IV secretory pathway TrbD component